MGLNKTTSGMLAALALSILCAYFYPQKEQKAKISSQETEHTVSVKSSETSIQIDAAVYFAPSKTSVDNWAEDQSIQPTKQIYDDAGNGKDQKESRREIVSTHSYLEKENQSSFDAKTIEGSLRQFETTNHFESANSRSERNDWEFGNTDSSENSLTEKISATSLPRVNQMQDGGKEEKMCYLDALQNRSRICRARCEKNSFSLPGMSVCLPWLTCKQINAEVKIKQELDDSGTVKKVHLAKWRNYTVAMLRLKDQQYQEDFQTGLEVLKLFTGEKSVVQLLGFCENTHTIVTEYHPLGNILNFLRLLKQDDRFQLFNTTKVRFSLCLDYAKILVFLHNNPLGPRIMCDSSQLGKVLHQYLVTNSLELILSDVDTIPMLGSDSKLVCGKRMLNGDLLAPEQQWQLESDKFDVNKQTRYDEKVDIWKIPDVCNYILTDHSDIISYHLFDIHNKCKNHLPKNRPTAKEVVEEYKHVYKFLFGR